LTTSLLYVTTIYIEYSSITDQINMPSRLPDNYKSLVIQEWLKGEQRDKIAADMALVLDLLQI
jgi:hypothetical protein